MKTSIGVFLIFVMIYFLSDVIIIIIIILLFYFFVDILVLIIFVSYTSPQAPAVTKNVFVYI